jgi:hypothetical protein
MASTQVKVGQKLVFMDRKNFLDRFDFDENGLLDNQVGSVIPAHLTIDTLRRICPVMALPR